MTAVLGPEVLDEDLGATFCLGTDLAQKPPVLLPGQAGHRRRGLVAEGAMPVGVLVHQLAAEGDLDPLDGVHDEQAEAPVEGVAPPHHIEAGTGLEVVASRLPEGVQVPGQPVVAHGGEALLKRGWIGVEAA